MSYLLDTDFYYGSATGNYYKETPFRVCNDFEMDLSKINAIITDNAPNITRGALDFIAESCPDALHVGCTTHLLDKHLRKGLSFAQAKQCQETLRPLFGKLCVLLKRKFLDFWIDGRRVQVTLPVLRRCFRAWGDDWRALLDQLLEYDTEAVRELMQKYDLVGPATKLHLIYIWLHEEQDHLKCVKENNDEKTTKGVVNKALLFFENNKVDVIVLQLRMLKRMFQKTFDACMHLQGREYSTIHIVLDVWTELNVEFGTIKLKNALTEYLCELYRGDGWNNYRAPSWRSPRAVPKQRGATPSISSLPRPAGPISPPRTSKESASSRTSGPSSTIKLFSIILLVSSDHLQ